MSGIALSTRKPTAAEPIWSRPTCAGPGETNPPWELTEVQATGNGAAAVAVTDARVAAIGVPLPLPLPVAQPAALPPCRSCVCLVH